MNCLFFFGPPYSLAIVSCQITPCPPDSPTASHNGPVNMPISFFFICGCAPGRGVIRHPQGWGHMHALAARFYSVLDALLLPLLTRLATGRLMWWAGIQEASKSSVPVPAPVDSLPDRGAGASTFLVFLTTLGRLACGNRVSIHVLYTK